MNFRRYGYKALTTTGGEIYERMNATNREDTRNEFYVWHDLYNAIQRELDRRTINGEPCGDSQKENEDIRRLIEDKRIRYYEVAEALGKSESDFSKLLRKQLNPEQKQEIIKAVEGIKA